MIFFFYGPNTYMAKRKIRDMAAAYITKSGSDFGLEKFDGSTITFESLGGSLTAMPFLANSRLVIIEGLSANKLVAEQMPGLLDQVADTTVAVFYEPNVDQRTTYFKAMSKSKMIRAVKFEFLNHTQLSAWIRRETENLGGAIDGATVSWLIETVGEDQWRLAQELNKLVNFRSQITLETAKQLVVASPVQSIFDLVDAMSAHQAAKALTIFKGLIAERTNELYILTMITWQLRNLLLAKASGLSNSSELAKQAGISPYVAGKALTIQRTMSEKYLKAAYLAAVEADYAIKSGRGNPEQLVEQLIYQVATA
jgi:DNA polymerase III delta subunit